MKTELENYLDGAALDESMEKHDAKYHDGHFDPETMSCGKREQMAKGDDPQLGGAVKSSEAEVSAAGSGGGGAEEIPTGRFISSYTGELSDGELDDFLEDLGGRLKGIRFDHIELGDVDDSGSGSLTYETPMVSAVPEVEEDGGEWVVKTRIEPTVDKNDMRRDARKMDESLDGVGLGTYVYSPELVHLSSEDETGMRTARMKSDFTLEVRDNAKFWKYVKGFRKPGRESEAA